MNKNILMFSLHYEPYIGGAEIFVKEFVKKSKNKFTIITRMGEKQLPKIEIKDNVRIIRVGKGKYDKYLYPFLAYKKALKLHKEKSFDIVHSIMANHAGLAGMFFKNKTKIPFVLNLQMGQTDTTIKKKFGILYPFYKKIYSSADKIHAISIFLKKRAISFGADKNKIEIIPNGVDLRKFDTTNYSKEEINELKEKLGLKNKKIIVTSSRLSEKNGIEYVIKAIAKLKDEFPDLVFLILGIGELEEKLKQLTKYLKVENNVIFHGFVENQKLPLYLTMSDYFIRPSLSEGQGISFIEAMAMDIPVITTPVGGIPDFIFDKKTGFFCKPKDVDSTVETIKYCLTHDMNEVIENAHDLVLKKYNWDDIIIKIDKIYEEFK